VSVTPRQGQVSCKRQARGTAAGSGAATGPLADFEYYFAGPPPMITAVQQVLLLGEVPHDRLHFDRFL
jgi:toluene monooxygenase electron transfer component